MAVPADRFHQRFCRRGGLTGGIGVHGMRTGIHNPSAFRCLRRAGSRVYGRGTAHIPQPHRGRIYMKQSAAKTLGVAALGAAFAAAGAGAANAAPAGSGRHRAAGHRHPARLAGAERLPRRCRVPVQAADPGASRALERGLAAVQPAAAQRARRRSGHAGRRPARRPAGRRAAAARERPAARRLTAPPLNAPMGRTPWSRGAPHRRIRGQRSPGGRAALSSEGSRIHSAM